MKPAQRKFNLAIAALALTLVATSNAFAAGAAVRSQGDSDSSAFTTILGHYEGIRQALLADETEGVAVHAKAIGVTAQALEKEFSAEKAGVKPDLAKEARDLLHTISQAAAELAGAIDLEAARQALYPLSKTLVRYRKLATGELPAVAYCPMAKKSWLQPSGEIGNPYLGQQMPTCGEIVDG